jgi:lysozyme family protein
VINGDPFDALINFLLRPDVEGGLSMDKTDPGNWTGGKVGVGTLKGTKYGISAASYPALDIQSLTQQTVKPIYFKDFWGKAGCHLLPKQLAFLTGDAAVQHGPARAVEFLQAALKVPVDGAVGPVTIAAARNAVTEDAVDAALAERIKFYIKLPNQSTQDVNAGGWAHRLVKVCREVMT